MENEPQRDSFAGYLGRVISSLSILGTLGPGGQDQIVPVGGAVRHTGSARD